jgi:hypothetical protein
VREATARFRTRSPAREREARRPGVASRFNGFNPCSPRRSTCQNATSVRAVRGDTGEPRRRRGEQQEERRGNRATATRERVTRKGRERSRRVQGAATAAGVAGIDLVNPGGEEREGAVGAASSGSTVEATKEARAQITAGWQRRP